MAKGIRYFRNMGSRHGSYYAFADERESTPIAKLSISQFPDITYTHVNPHSTMNLNLGRSLDSDKSLGIGHPNFQESKEQVLKFSSQDPLERVANPHIPVSESGLVQDVKEADQVFMASTVRPARENEQLQLFLHRPSSPAHVDVLTSRDDPAARISAMTMLGMADIDSRRRTGRAMEASTNLSKYSKKIVGKLESRGVIPKNIGLDKESNEYTFDSASYELSQEPSIERIRHSSEDITNMSRIARHHIRGLMHPKKPEPENNNPEGWRQPTLWED